LASDLGSVPDGLDLHGCSVSQMVDSTGLSFGLGIAAVASSVALITYSAGYCAAQESDSTERSAAEGLDSFGCSFVQALDSVGSSAD